MVRLGLALAVLVASARPARACDCPPLDEAAALARHALAFDGWILEAPQPWRCALPPAPRPRGGCVRIAIVDRADCKARGDLLALETHDRQLVATTSTSIDDDATTLCGVAPGRYLLATSPRWLGAENGTLDHGRTLDVVPGGSYVVFAPGDVGQRLRVGVFRSLKGRLPREVVVTTERACGTPFFEPGQAWRFFADAGADGAVVVKGCSSARTLTDPERAQPVGPPDASAAPPPPPSSPPRPASPPPASSKRGGCSAAGTTPGLASLALLLLRLLRRRG